MSKSKFRYENISKEDLPKAIEELKIDALFSNENFNDMPPMAESHFLICISLLEQAENHARLLNYNYMKSC